MQLDMPAYARTRFPYVHRRGQVLYYNYRDEGGRWLEVRYGKGEAKDAAAAQANAQERADRIKNRLSDPRQEAMAGHANRPIGEIVAEYKATLEQSASAAHVKWTIRYLERAIAGCELRRLADLDPVRLVRWLGQTFDSPRSHNAALKAVRGLVNWAIGTGRLAFNPIPAQLVATRNEDADRRRLSRALTQDEFARLLDAAPKRRLYYLLAAYTGLRWREIARLTWAMVDGGHLSLPADVSRKAGRGAVLPLADHLTAELAKARPGQASGQDRLFRREVRLRTWKADLERAGLVGDEKAGYVDDRGRRIDRKCLRMSFCTWLKEAGVDIRDAQRLMRHSDINLTASIYTDARMVNLKAAVGRLCEMPVKPETEQIVKTG